MPGKLHEKLKVIFIVVGEIKSPQTRSLRVNGYQAVRKAEEVQILRERATMLPSTCTAYLVFFWSEMIKQSKRIPQNCYRF